MSRGQERLGLLCAALCAVIGAFVPAFAKLTTDRGDPFFVAAATTALAGAFAAIVLWARGELRLLVQPVVGPRLLAISALGTALAFLLFFIGARQVSAIETVLCLQTEPAYSLLLAWLFLGHRPTARRVVAVGVLLVGIFLAVGGRGLSASFGVWVLLLTPLCWQASHLIVLRGLPGVSPQALTGARYVNGGMMLLLLWLLVDGPRSLPSAAQAAEIAPLLAMQGVVLSYVGTLLWYQALTRLDLARSTAIVVPSIPLLSLGASFVLLGEVPTPPQWVGLLLTATGVFAFVTAPDAARAVAPAPLQPASTASLRESATP